LVLPNVDAVAGVRLLSTALGSPFSVSAAAWLAQEGAARVPELAGFAGSVALVRIEDIATSVAYRTTRLRDDLRHPDAHILDDGASRAVWQAVRDLAPLPLAPDDAVWRVSVRPSADPAPCSSQVLGSRCFSTGASIRCGAF
jgi:glycolate oxidase FAD binding subunit